MKPSTKERYESVYRNYIKNSPLSKIKIKDITLNDIQNYYTQLLYRGHSDELEMLFLTALNSGLRQGELFALTWDDINFENGYIDVNKTVKTPVLVVTRLN